MKKMLKAASLVVGVAMAFSFAGCSFTQTTTSDIYSDIYETRPGQSNSVDPTGTNGVSSGDNGNASGNKTTKKKNTKTTKGNNNSGGNDGDNIFVTHTTRKKGAATLDFTPVADAGANYNVKGTVKIAVDTARPTDFDAMFDVMQKLYPNVKIEYDYWAHGDSQTTMQYLTTRAATGKMADIIFDDAGTFSTYIRNGWVYPITKFYNADPEKANLSDNLRNSYTYCGELYALPNSAHFDVEVFNVDLLNKLNMKLPGMKWTMDDYEKYLRAAAAKFSSGLCVGVSNLGDSYNRYGWYTFMQRANSCGQWGYNYDTQQADADYLVDGFKQMYKWRTMTSGVEAWYESTQKGSNGVSQLESNLGISNPDAAWTSGKALIFDWNTGGTNKTSLSYKFKYAVVPTPNTNGRLSMHIDCSFMTTAVKDENAEAAYQLLRFMTISTNGNLARLTMYEDSQKGKYALNSRIYYPVSRNKSVISKFNNLSVATETDKYLVENIPNSSRYDDTKIVPNLETSFYAYAAVAANDVRDGKDKTGAALREAVTKWNAQIKKDIEAMNKDIKARQNEFNQAHK